MNTDILSPQIAYQPEVSGTPLDAPAYLIGGMGGSGLPARVARYLGLASFHSWQSYGLPDSIPENAALVAISYSGDTEETLSFFEEARARGLPIGVVTSGGKLLAAARSAAVPYVVVPGGMQPRDALVVMTKALFTLTSQSSLSDIFSDTGSAAEDSSKPAEDLAEFLVDHIPVLYASTENETLAYIMKINFNETAKVPAFSNVFPELNHNEMQGLDPLGGTAKLSQPLGILVVKDPEDDPRITRRMAVFGELCKEKGLHALEFQLPDDSCAYRLIYAWMLARRAAHILAERYGVPADTVPLVEEFKKRLAS